MKIALLAALAACGGDDAGVDAPVTGNDCAVNFSGNYTETADVPGCVSLASGVISLDVPSTTIQTSYAMSFDLGARPAAGTYTPQTVASWSSLATEEISVTGECLFSAGSVAVPNGSFVLRLDSLSPLAGELSIVHYVLALPNTTCGAGDTETVDVQF